VVDWPRGSGGRDPWLEMSGAGIISTDGTKTKTKRFKVKHPKRKLYRSSEPLLSVFMWGINHTVKELEHVSIPVMLMPDDFRAFSKVKVDNQAFNKENLPSHFKVRGRPFRLNSGYDALKV
jgi:hypothetical protein